jgi:hypothetical protein
VLSNEAFRLIESVAEGKVLDSGFFLIHALKEAPPIFRRPPVAIPEEMEERLVQFVPQLVRYGIFDHGAFQHISVL